MGSIVLLSDIHGNLTALEAVLKKIYSIEDIEGIILLGDVIDYGMRSNEVIEKINNLSIPIICNIWGNHEYAICNQDFTRFSSGRGVESAKNTLKNLSNMSKDYLKNKMIKEGFSEFEIKGKKCLAVHGSLEDPFWRSVEINGLGQRTEYAKYDYVFMGHSHVPMYANICYKSENINTRNKKKSIFLNPGSVGQPRNLNPMSQFLVLNYATEGVQFCAVPYDVEQEQLQFTNVAHSFYKERLKWGV